MIAGADAATVAASRVQMLAAALDIWRRPWKCRLGDDDYAAQRLGACRRLRHSADHTFTRESRQAASGAESEAREMVSLRMADR